MGEWSGSFIYRARDRFQGPLLQVVLDHLEEFAVQLAWPGDAGPRPQAGLVELLRKFIECGLFRFGVARYRCPKCSTKMVPVAVIMNDRELVRLLEHLGVSSALSLRREAAA